MSVIESTRGLKFYGNYRAKVLYHGNHGQVKLNVLGITPEEFVSDKSLSAAIPWAEPASPLYAGTHAGNGVFSYPNIGSTVWCFFEDGDQMKPVYFAACLGGQEAATQYSKARPLPTEEVQDAYIHTINCGNSRVEISETGVITLMAIGNDGSNYAQIILDGSTGKVSINTSGSINENSGGQISQIATNKISQSAAYLDSQSSVNTSIKSAAVNINGKSVKVSGNGGQAVY